MKEGLSGSRYFELFFSTRYKTPPHKKSNFMSFHGVCLEVVVITLFEQWCLYPPPHHHHHQFHPHHHHSWKL